MKKITGLIVLNIAICLAVLLIAAFGVIRIVVDPAVGRLTAAAAGLGAEAQNQLMPQLVQLKNLYSEALWYLPAALGGCVLLAVLALLLLIWGRRRTSSVATGSPEREPKPATETQTPAAAEADQGALRLLALLQDKGRLVDFLEEDISGYQDSQIGAAVRQIHRDCRTALHECLALTPVRPEAEGETVTVPQGFDASEFRLTGRVAARPPYRGILQHCGWKVVKIDLPAPPRGQNPSIIAPAEVEIGGDGEETRL